MKCIINQGLPGSGKSTSIKEHKRAGHIGHTEVCSADHFFLDDWNEYQFKPELTGDAHLACYRKFELVTRKHRKEDSTMFIPPADFVFVDNTNTQLWEMYAYIQLAHLRGYKIEVHTFECPVDLAVRRNTHDVPRAVIETMAKRMEAPHPFWPITHIIHHYNEV